jgi:hypothetical protein
MSQHNDKKFWRDYEAKKAELRRYNLTPVQYEEQVQAWLDAQRAMARSRRAQAH